MIAPLSPLPGHRSVMLGVTVLGFFLAAAGGASAHQVPSLTVEALFAADRSYTLRVSLDPRLFLSDQPSSLPPVPIEWYREQSETELEATRKKAADYLRRAVTLRFGAQSVMVDHCEYQPMDGATNLPLSADTKEVHLLATMKGQVPGTENSFAISLSQDANVSMILMSSFEGEMERRPNVIFPGETTRPYLLPLAVPPVVANSAALEKPAQIKEAEARAQPRHVSWTIIAAGGVVLAVLAVVFARRAKR